MVSWFEKLELLKAYLDTYKKRPAQQDKDPNTKNLGLWIGTQQKNFVKREFIMSDESIYSTWNKFINSDDYKVYFLDNNTVWKQTLTELKQYINTYKIRPSQTSKDPNTKKLGSWIGTQQTNFAKRVFIMSDESIYSTWNKFINSDKYKVYFLDNNTVWKQTLTELKQYINTYKIRPSQTSKDPNTKKLGLWIGNQRKNFAKKKNIMKDESIYFTWNEFINSDEYKVYLLDNNSVWKQTLTELKQYINTYKIRPSQRSKDPNTKKLGSWIRNQQTNFAKRTDIMKDESIYSTWNEFINSDEYKVYLLDNNSVWKQTLTELKAYFGVAKKRPSKASKDLKIKTLGQWLSAQKQNYKKQTYIMKDTEIRTEWQKFITSDQYKQYFEEE
jgi:hypothetical protein